MSSTELVPIADVWNPGAVRESDQGPIIRADYVDFVRVLRLAYEQTAKGKGHERHGGGLPFARQMVMTEIEQTETIAFAIGQARKKLLESLRLPPERQRAELIGAIVYTVAAYLGSELLEKKE